jgi:hypothetical protein
LKVTAVGAQIEGLECREVGSGSANEQGSVARSVLEGIGEAGAARSFQLNELDDVARRLPMSRERNAHPIRQCLAIQCSSKKSFDHLPPGSTKRLVQGAAVRQHVGGIRG